MPSVGAQTPPPRFPDLAKEGMTDAQKRVYDAIAGGPRGEALFKRAVSTLGEQGVVDLIGVSGYYTLVSMVLNVAEIPLPAGVSSPW